MLRFPGLPLLCSDGEIGAEALCKYLAWKASLLDSEVTAQRASRWIPSLKYVFVVSAATPQEALAAAIAQAKALSSGGGAEGGDKTIVPLDDARKMTFKWVTVIYIFSFWFILFIFIYLFIYLFVCLFIFHSFVCFSVCLFVLFYFLVVLSTLLSVLPTLSFKFFRLQNLSLI